MENIVLQRIKTILENKKISKSQFARELEMEQVTVNNQINAKRGISFELIFNILNHYSDLSAEWLLRGTGDMFLEKNTSAATSTEVTADERQQLLDRITQLSEEKGELKAECKYLRQELSRLTAINPDKKAI